MDSAQKPSVKHGQPAPPVITPPTQYTDGFGISSIILAALFLTIPGLILGIIGEFKAKNRKSSPVLSRIGWITNLLMLLFSIAVVALVFGVAMNSNEFKTAWNEQVKTGLSDYNTYSADTYSVHIPLAMDNEGENYPASDLALSNSSADLYFQSFHDSATDITDGTTLAQYADTSFNTFTSDSDFSEQSREKLAPGYIPNPRNLEVLDYKIIATSSINKYVYVERYIKTKTGFYTLTTWTKPGKLDSNESNIKQILGSFKELSN